MIQSPVKGLVYFPQYMEMIRTEKDLFSYKK